MQFPPVNEKRSDVDELVTMTATQMSKLLRDRALSARELLEAHLAQVDRVNSEVNAIVSLDPEGARVAAHHADEDATTGAALGPLHGLPIAFKDTHETAGLRTTHGSVLLEHNVPKTNDLIVQRIIDAGAIRIGKTNVPEFAAGSHTFNRIFGVTRNPYDTTKSAGGSSGGAAAALAAYMQPIADGSDMGGSLRNPASFCNVVGLRPTPGTVASPRNSLGYCPLSTAGPMARTVDDLELLLRVIAHPHRHDPLSFGRGVKDAIDPPAEVAGLRVAWAPTLGGQVPVDSEVVSALQGFIDKLVDHGAHVETDCLDLSGADDVFRTLRAAEFHAAWKDALAQSPEAFKPDLAWNIQCGENLTGFDVIRAQAEMTRLHRVAESFFARYDILLAPVSQVAPFDAEFDYPPVVDGVNQTNYLDWMRASSLITPVGVPALSLPAAFTDSGLPIGIQMVGSAHSEQRLLSIARQFEAISGATGRYPAPMTAVTPPPAVPLQE